MDVLIQGRGWPGHLDRLDMVVADRRAWPPPILLTGRQARARCVKVVIMVVVWWWYYMLVTAGEARRYHHFYCMDFENEKKYPTFAEEEMVSRIVSLSGRRIDKCNVRGRTIYNLVYAVSAH